MQQVTFTSILSRLEAKKKIMKNFVTGKAHENHRRTSFFGTGPLALYREIDLKCKLLPVERGSPDCV
jgi:hypothetical protein